MVRISKCVVVLGLAVVGVLCAGGVSERLFQQALVLEDVDDFTKTPIDTFYFVVVRRAEHFQIFVGIWMETEIQRLVSSRRRFVREVGIVRVHIMEKQVKRALGRHAVLQPFLDDIVHDRRGLVIGVCVHLRKHLGDPAPISITGYKIERLIASGGMGRVYEALDRACGELRDAFGRDALCIVLSDHGSGGASRNIVHLGRRLAECGFLERASSGGDFWARHARDLALRALPPRLAERVFRRVRGAAARVESMARFGGINWSHTSAFSEEANTQPGIWINLLGREASGSVAPADYERVRSELIDCLRDWKLPDGGPVVARAWRREEVHSGPYVDRAPDIVLELADDAGYGLSLVPTPWREHAGPSVRTLDRHELAGGRGRGMNGTHRPEGVWIATGAEAARLQPTGTNARPSLRDVAPTILGAMGIPWTDRDEAGPDGADFLEPRRDYTPEEEERVAARLRALGYLE